MQNIALHNKLILNTGCFRVAKAVTVKIIINWSIHKNP